MASDLTALILECDEGEFTHQFYVDTFPGKEIGEGKKLIMTTDNHHVEIIYTNELLSISCYFEVASAEVNTSSINYDASNNGEIKFSNFTSITKLAGIAHQNFRDKEYSIYRLGYYASFYHCELPDINTAIREFDYLIFDGETIRILPDDILLEGLQKIYLLLEEVLDRATDSVLSFKPINFHMLETLIEDYEPVKNNWGDEMEFSIVEY